MTAKRQLLKSGTVSSPGCWMLTKIALPSGVSVIPVISHSLGPTRNRRRLGYDFTSVGTGYDPTLVEKW